MQSKRKLGPNPNWNAVNRKTGTKVVVLRFTSVLSAKFGNELGQ